jgi:hypothetical protein
MGLRARSAQLDLELAQARLFYTDFAVGCVGGARGADHREQGESNYDRRDCTAKQDSTSHVCIPFS